MSKKSQSLREVVESGRASVASSGHKDDIERSLKMVEGVEDIIDTFEHLPVTEIEARPILSAIERLRSGPIRIDHHPIITDVRTRIIQCLALKVISKKLLSARVPRVRQTGGGATVTQMRRSGAR